jgi:hypothetical protein
MRLRVEAAAGPARRRCLEHQRHHGDGRTRQRLFRQTAFVHRRDDLVAVVVTAARHLQVIAGGDAAYAVVDAAPVRHHQAFEAPFVAQDAGEQRRMFGGISAIDQVVGAHHRPRLRLAHRDLEGRQVDLVQAALVDIRAGGHAFGFLAVRREVLQRRAHALALHAVDVGRGHAACEHRVFREVFEVAPAQRRALDVDTGPEQHLNVRRLGLAPERSAHFTQQAGVPGGRQRRRGGEAGGRHAHHAQPVGIDGLAQAVRSVGKRDRRQAQALDAVAAPPAVARQQRGLLLDAHAGDEFSGFFNGFSVPTFEVAAFIVGLRLHGGSSCARSTDGARCGHRRVMPVAASASMPRPDIRERMSGHAKASPLRRRKKRAASALRPHRYRHHRRLIVCSARFVEQPPHMAAE